MAALQDEFPDGKQEQEDKNGVEFGGEESVDHEQFSPSPASFCGFHDRPPGTSNYSVPDTSPCS
jgi:hypothetical protein